MQLSFEPPARLTQKLLWLVPGGELNPQVPKVGGFEGIEMSYPPVIVIASECVRRGFGEY